MDCARVFLTPEFRPAGHNPLPQPRPQALGHGCVHAFSPNRDATQFYQRLGAATWLPHAPTCLENKEVVKAPLYIEL